MPTPENNTNYVYRMRVGNSNDHNGLFYYSSAYKHGGLDGSPNELWQLSGSKLLNVQTGSYIGGTTGNATAVAASSAQTLTFPTGASTGTNYIKGANGYYLNWTASGTLTWQPSATTSWRFERLIKYTGIPVYGTDYFSEKCGNTTGGTFPSTWATKIRTLYKNCFGITTYSNATHDPKAFVNLYGAMYNSTVSPTTYRGKMHTGMDMNLSEGSAIRCPKSGKVVNDPQVGNTYGVVAVEVSPGVNYLFAHMKNITLKKNDPVSTNGIVGYQSYTGLSSSTQTHLHFEVTGSTAISPIPSGSWESIGSTLSPYSYID